MTTLKGAIKRAKDEYKYLTLKGWTYQDVGDFWDTVKDYDEIDDETYAYRRRFYDSVEMFHPKNRGRVLDIDARTGNGTVFYHQKGYIGSSVCVTPSPFFLDVCKERLKKYKVNTEQLLLLRTVPLKLDDESFDTILCFESIEHVSTHKEFLSELNRLLKKDGKMILTMPNILWEPVHWLVAIFKIHHSEGPHRFLTRKKINKLLHNAGFKVIKESTRVLIPVGPRWLTRFGEILEKIFMNNLMHLIGLRRMYVCVKQNQ